MSEVESGIVVPFPGRVDPNRLTWEEARQAGLEVVSETVADSGEHWDGPFAQTGRSRRQ